MYIGCPRYHIDLIVCFILFWMLQKYMGEELVITVRIRENIPIGTIICNLFDIIIPRPSKYTKYTLIKNKYFNIEDSRKVVVIGEVDRDNNLDLCIEKNVNNSCVWKNILFSSNGAHLFLRVIVDDENDNSPNWVEKSTIIEITENVLPELLKLELPKAQDPDDAPNNTVLYMIDPPSKYVFIVNETNKDGLTPYIKITQTIDREIINWHNVTVLAIDGGSPPRTGSLFLMIKIIDINDNNPTFSSSIYKHSLAKYAKVNDMIDLNIKATDSDEGMNGNITYKLSLNSPFVIQSCFDINSQTAEIIIKKPLVGHCFLSEYRLSITAFDHGNPVLSAKTSVLLTFDSQNLYAPNMEMSNKETNIYIFENNAIGFQLKTIAVKDKDAGNNGLFQCFLKSNNSNKLSLISNKSNLGDITIVYLIASGIFDREIETKLLVTVVCKDLGEPPLSSSQALTVIILDVNDNKPYFKEHLYHFKSYEENEPYQRLAQLTAFDHDEGYNSMLAYHIHPTTFEDVKSYFTIDINGHILAKDRLDREKFPRGFYFSVIVTDQGRPPLKGSTNVYIELLDINDNPPKFYKNHYNFSFLEDIGNKHQSRIVGEISAWDPDLKNNSVVTYKLTSPSPLPFKLNPESGQLYSYSLTDRETQVSHYIFSVLAMDNPSNMLYRKTAVVTVSIEISDYNDNRPTFVFPNEENNKIQLSYFSPMGSIVTTVRAVDKDSGLNSKIEYSLVDPDRNILFSINLTSGDLMISTVLNSIHEGIENLFIRASDCGSPPLTAIQRLVVEIGEFKLPIAWSSDNQNNEPFLSDQATYIIVGIVLGTFFICCGLVTGICTMTYRQWRTSRTRTSSNGQYVTVEDPAHLQTYIDNYMEMKEII